jgi:PEP-CTERM motif-containing protein
VVVSLLPVALAAINSSALSPSARGTSTDIAVASIVEQFTAPVATELLIIDVSGNATYNVDGSPLFEAVPEPGTLSLFGGGTILLVASKLRMRLRRKTAQKR